MIAVKLRQTVAQRTSNGRLFVFLEVVVDEAKDEGRLRDVSVSTFENICNAEVERE